MNDKQNAYLNMFQAVSDVLEANKSKYENIAVMSAAADELKEKISLIRDADRDRSAMKVPAATAEKQEAEETMVEAALPLARITNVYARDTANHVLLMQTNVTKSMFYKLQDNAAIILAQTILDKSTENKEALADYGLTQKMLDDLSEAVNTFLAIVQKPRNTRIERKGKTKSLAQLTADTKSLLHNRLDKLMSLFKQSAPPFYNTYFSARNVINTSYRKKTQE